MTTNQNNASTDRISTPRRTWTTVSSGEYEGEILPSIALTNPDWFFSAMDRQDYWSKDDPIAAEAEFVCERAKKIAIPPCETHGPLVLDCAYDFENHTPIVECVPANEPLQPYKHSYIRRPYIDLSLARWYFGGRGFRTEMLIDLVADIYFAGTNRHVQPKRFIAFFNDDRNFYKGDWIPQGPEDLPCRTFKKGAQKRLGQRR